MAATDLQDALRNLQEVHRHKTHGNRALENASLSSFDWTWYMMQVHDIYDTSSNTHVHIWIMIEWQHRRRLHGSSVVEDLMELEHLKGEVGMINSSNHWVYYCHLALNSPHWVQCINPHQHCMKYWVQIRYGEANGARYIGSVGCQIHQCFHSLCNMVPVLLGETQRALIVY